MKQTPFEKAEVTAVFHQYPLEIREKLLSLRQLIIDTADKMDGIGTLEETLKWGQPSYLTKQPKSGTTIRLGWNAGPTPTVGLYFHCQSSMIPAVRERYPTQLRYEGNRAILLALSEALPTEPLTEAIELALTYHQRKNNSPKQVQSRANKHLR